MTVGEVCSRLPVTIQADQPVTDAAKLMRDRHVGTVIVVDRRNTAPIGILTDRDVVVSAIAQSPDKLASLTVGDVMTSDVITTRAADTLSTALATMQEHGIRRLPVLGMDGTLEGLLSFDDVLEVMTKELGSLVGLVAREQRQEHVTRR